MKTRPKDLTNVKVIIILKWRSTPLLVRLKKTYADVLIQLTCNVKKKKPTLTFQSRASPSTVNLNHARRKTKQKINDYLQ